MAKNIKTIHNATTIQTVCYGCRTPLNYSPQFEGLPCNQYCCGCCPEKNGTCPKEHQFGSVLDALKKWQKK